MAAQSAKAPPQQVPAKRFPSPGVLQQLPAPAQERQVPAAQVPSSAEARSELRLLQQE